MAPSVPLRSLARRLCLIAAGLLALACGPQGATPVPQPPLGVFPIDAVGTPKPDPATRGDVRLSSRPSGSSKGSPLPGATIRITNLDGAAPTSEVVANPLGAFSVGLTVNLGDELRFEWLLGDRRSIPADAVLTSGPTDLALVPSARFACLTLRPPYFVGFGSAQQATLIFENRCAEAIVLDNPSTRLGLDDFALQTTLPLEVPAGSNGSVAFAFSRTAAGLREDIVFLDVTLAGETVRYPITLSSEPPLTPAAD